MPQLRTNTAFVYQPEIHAPAAEYFFEQSHGKDDFLLIAKLNLKLQLQFGEEFYLQSFSGSNLLKIPIATLNSLAACYAEVFNESWGENWSMESALEEIMSCINCAPMYLPIMTLLFKEDKVIGFSWAYLLDTASLAEDSAPFSSSDIKRHESVEVAKYWMDEVGQKDKLLSIRELGVLKAYRQDKTPYLTIPIFEKVSSLDCNVAFFRTKLTSKAFKWSLGVGFVPLQLFIVDGLLLMRGNIRYAMSLLYGSIERKNKRKTQVELIGNIKRYMCD